MTRLTHPDFDEFDRLNEITERLGLPRPCHQEDLSEYISRLLAAIIERLEPQLTQGDTP